MDKKKIKIPAPKTRRTWKIKPYTRIKPSGKIYQRRRQKAENSDLFPQSREGISPVLRKVGSDFRFCPRCGGALTHKQMGEHRRQVCSACGFVFYQNPVPAVAMIIPRGDKIVLVRRAEEPYRGHWCLPAGFMELNETPQQCAVREAKEETGLDIRVRELFGVYAGQDDPRARVVLIIYLVEMVAGELRAGDDASEARLFGPDELPEEIAFRSHRQAIGQYFGGEDEQNPGP
jgi:8-oxo-dGTP diphosphatase